MTNYIELKKKLNQLKQEASEAGKAYLGEVTKGFFEKHPEVKAFQFHAYTPYFCDGDTPEYGVYRDFHIKFIDGDDDFLDPYEEICEPLNKEIEKLFREVEDEIFKEVFGDHVEITADREGFHVEEYNHD